MAKIKTFFKANSITFLLILVFLVSVILRTILGIFFGQMNVFYDELLHWNLSKSIFYHLGSSFRSDVLSYKEILYSVVLALSHFYGNTEVQYFAAVGINSILMSSVVFPVYFMSNRFLHNKKFALIVTFLSILIPEMVYTAKVIQENLYYPMVIWFFFLFIFFILKDQYRPRNIIIMGAYVFLVSLCKQMALNIFTGMILFYILEFVFFDKENRKKCAMSIVWFTAIFMGLKLGYGVLFNIVNGISSISSSEVTIAVILENLFDTYLLMQLVYPAMTYFLLAALYFGFFTVFMPLSIAGKLSVKERKLLTVVLAIFVSTVCVICLRIIPSENLNDETIRFHFRYLFFLIIPLFILFFSIYDKVRGGMHNVRFYVIAFVFIILLNYINILPAEGAKIDCVGANYLKWLFDNDMMVRTLRILIIAFILAGSYLLYKKKIKILYAAVVGIIIISGIINSCFTYSRYYQNKLDSVEKKEDAFTLNSYFQDTIHSDMSSLLIVSESKVGDAKLEVYLQYPKYYFCKKQDLTNFLENYTGEESFGTLNLYSFNKQFTDETFHHPQYIICSDPLEVEGYQELDIGLDYYFLYEKN